jgi:hypothetical protein
MELDLLNEGIDRYLRIYAANVGRVNILDVDQLMVRMMDCTNWTLCNRAKFMIDSGVA